MSEHDEQVAVFQWAEVNQFKWPELWNMFAIPNGANKSIASAMKFKREGLKAGVPDIFLPAGRVKYICGYPTHEYAYLGLFIEMKDGIKKKPTKIQEQRIEGLREAGYKVVVAHSADEAIKAIESYLK